MCPILHLVEMSFLFSRKATSVIVDANKGDCDFDFSLHHDQLFRIRAEVTNVKKQVYEDDMIGSFDTVHRRAIMRARTEKLSGWLTVLLMVSLFYLHSSGMQCLSVIRNLF